MRTKPPCLDRGKEVAGNLQKETCLFQVPLVMLPLILLLSMGSHHQNMNFISMRENIRKARFKTMG